MSVNVITPDKEQTLRPRQSFLGCLLMMSLSISSCGPNGAANTSEVSAETPKPTAVSKADLLKAMDAKISEIALMPLDSKYDPSGYTKLGKRVWDTSNELRHWAGIAALQNDKCGGVDAIAVWEGATRSQLSWHVVCGDERFVISEAQARSAKAHFDPNTTPVDGKARAGAIQIAQPMSAAWTNFNEQEAVDACEKLMLEASVNRKSFETSGDPQIARNEETGQATIVRDYSGANAMGGTLSGKYKCVVSAVDGAVVSLKGRDALGDHKVI